MYFAPILCCIIFGLPASSQYASAQPEQGPGPEEDVEFYRLALQWGNSFCNSQRVCHPRVPQDFVIHGLWASKTEDKILECDHDNPQLTRAHHGLLYSDVEGIRGIHENWPNLLAGSTNFQHWDRQWKKHGRCLGLEPRFYFQNAIVLKKLIEGMTQRRGLVHFFREKGLPPSNDEQYDPEEFKLTIDNQMHYRTILACNYNTNGEIQLYEIRFCFTQNWEFVDCPDSKNCSADGGRILFPRSRLLPAPPPSRLQPTRPPPPSRLPPTRPPPPVKAPPPRHNRNERSYKEALLLQKSNSSVPGKDGGVSKSESLRHIIRQRVLMLSPFITMSLYAAYLRAIKSCILRLNFKRGSHIINSPSSKL